MSKRVNSIEYLAELYKKGDGLEIQVDNDVTWVMLGEETIFYGSGYGDIIELWSLLFPNAEVDGV